MARPIVPDLGGRIRSIILICRITLVGRYTKKASNDCEQLHPRSNLTLFMQNRSNTPSIVQDSSLLDGAAILKELLDVFIRYFVVQVGDQSAHIGF